MTVPRHRYAIIRLSSIGDILHTSPLLKQLRALHRARGETIHITWVVEQRLATIVEHFSDVDAIIALPLPLQLTPLPLMRFFKTIVQEHLIAKLKEHTYDVILDPQGLLKSALIGAFMKRKLFIGFARPSSREGSHFFYQRRVTSTQLNIVDKNLELLTALNLPQRPPSAKTPARTSLSAQPSKQPAPTHLVINAPLVNVRLATNALTHIERFTQQINVKKLIVLTPWSTFYTRDMNEKLLHMVINTLYQYYKTPIVLISDARKRPLAQKIAQKYPQELRLSPQLSLAELFALIATSYLVVGVDSGPAYMAELLGKRVIILFGPTQRERQSPAFSQTLAAYYHKKGVGTSASPVNNGVGFTQALLAPYTCPMTKPQPITTSYRCINVNCPNEIRCMRHYEQRDLVTAITHLERIQT